MSTKGNPLGKGLAALLGDLDYTEELTAATGSRLATAPVQNLQPGKMQPRQRFDSENMAHLIDSIRQKGVLQPILVRPLQEDAYEIIAGERRWRASKEAGLKDVPIIIVDCDDEEALEVGLIENLQRDDLNAIEEAESLKKLIDDFGKTQEEVALSVSKSRSYVANLLRLTTLPDYVKDLIRNGKLSAGHARTLIGSTNMEELVQEILNEKLSVRETENRRRESSSSQSPKNSLGQVTEDPDLIVVQQIIEAALRLPTKININKRGGQIKLSFETYEQLDMLVSKLKNL
ncbi:MAG TPA: chromosome partitioning protein ParB [Holosporales bacterium]|nr:chromosome partitioning protein ParB [Holosporales bacterium]